jgi:hypothetical protein
LTFGLSNDEFWRLSLRELWNVRRAAAKRQTDEYERDVILAWQIERVAIQALQRQGERRLPSVMKLLGRKERVGQTREQMVNALKQLSVLYKIPLRIRKASDGVSDANRQR